MENIREKLLLDMGFSQKAVHILDQELNMGTMQNPVITEQHQGSCGDILFLSLNIQDDIIKDAMFEYIGCAGLQSCASAIIELIRGKSIDYASKIEIDDIITFLEGIPKQKYECAEIARDTLRKAINSHQNAGLNVIN
jgi:NifU-like protein involved in Fe-S cluster formation